MGRGTAQSESGVACQARRASGQRASTLPGGQRASTLPRGQRASTQAAGPAVSDRGGAAV
jgi:hypothetical protein